MPAAPDRTAPPAPPLVPTDPSWSTSALPLSGADGGESSTPLAPVHKEAVGSDRAGRPVRAGTTAPAPNFYCTGVAEGPKNKHITIKRRGPAGLPSPARRRLRGMRFTSRCRRAPTWRGQRRWGGGRHHVVGLVEGLAERVAERFAAAVQGLDLVLLLFELLLELLVLLGDGAGLLQLLAQLGLGLFEAGGLLAEVGGLLAGLVAGGGGAAVVGLQAGALRFQLTDALAVAAGARAGALGTAPHAQRRHQHHHDTLQKTLHDWFRSISSPAVRASTPEAAGESAPTGEDGTAAHGGRACRLCPGPGSATTYFGARVMPTLRGRGDGRSFPDRRGFADRSSSPRRLRDAGRPG